MSNATISIISIGLLDLAMMGLWLAIYFNRKRLVRWICLHKKSRGQLEAIETILAEALKEHYITYQDEEQLQIEMELPVDMVASITEDDGADLKTHLKKLFYFYLPKRKSHATKDDTGSKTS
jgi:hypothetical protein